MKRYILPLILLITACSSEFLPNNYSTEPIDNFESMWQNVSNKYSFFEFKQIDWDEVGRRYRAQVSSDMTDVELFDLLSDMLYELRDGHVNLNTPFDVSRNWQWYLDKPQNFNKYILERNYLMSDYRMTGSMANREMGGVGYIRYSSFSSSVTHDELDFVLEQFADLPGVIIDVRDNGGGSPLNAFTIASRFVNNEVHVYDIRHKSGPNKNDFSEKEAIYLKPSSADDSDDDASSYYPGKVVVLTNRLCYSATNAFVAIMKAVPNATIMGDWTGGGGGVPIGAELPNGWTYRFSATVTTLPNGFNVEYGIEPDLHVALNPTDEQNGIDTIIEEAISFILKEK